MPSRGAAATKGKTIHDPAGDPLEAAGNKMFGCPFPLRMAAYITTVGSPQQPPRATESRLRRRRPRFLGSCLRRPGPPCGGRHTAHGTGDANGPVKNYDHERRNREARVWRSG